MAQLMMRFLLFLLLLFPFHSAEGFVHPNVLHIRSTVELSAEQRRDFLTRLVDAGNSAALLSTLMLPSTLDSAVEQEQQQQQLTVYTTGKAPIVPGQSGTSTQGQVRYQGHQA